MLFRSAVNYNNSTQSSHNIFTHSNNTVSLPPGTYFVTMNIHTTASISSFVSLQVKRGSDSFGIFDTGPGSMGTRLQGSANNIVSITTADSIQFFVWCGQNTSFQPYEKENFASIIKIG